MKILMISGTFPPRSFGGVTKVTFNISKHLVKYGHEVIVFTTDAGDSQKTRSTINKYSEIEGIKIFYFKNINNYLAFHHRFYFPFGFISMSRRQIKNVDVIHIHENRSYLSIIATHFARKYQIPYIIQPHGDLPADFGKKRLKQIYDYFWGNSILKNAARIITLTPHESNQCMQKGIPKEKIEIIPNGFDYSNFPTPLEKGIFRRKFGIESRQKIILFLGRINEIKGLDLLVEAFFKVYKEIPDSILVIVGPDDGYQQFLMKLINKLNIQDRIIFTGPLYGPEKFYAYYDADIYVLPSRYEAFPNTILEAWACGTPVILTDSCALSTIAQQAGIVVKPNPIHLAEAIKNLLMDEKLRESCSKRGQSLVQNEFNMEMVARKIEECYQNVILNSKMKRVRNENVK